MLARPFSRSILSLPRVQQRSFSVCAIGSTDLIFCKVEIPKELQKIGRLNHVALAVPNLDKSVGFFKNVLGGEVSEKEVQPGLFSEIHLKRLLKNMVSPYLL